MLVQRFSEFTYLNDKIDNPSGYIVETLRAVLQAFNETDSFEQCLVNVVNRGSVGAPQPNQLFVNNGDGT